MVSKVSVGLRGGERFKVLPQMVRSAVELVVDLCKALKWQGHVLFEGWSSGCEEDENLEPLKTDG